MDNLKITDAEVSENGVEGAAHYFYGDPDENQKLFDRLPKLIAEKFNSFVDAVKSKLENIYTKEETRNEINSRIVEIGAGDMAKAIYDTDNDGIVDKAANAVNLGGVPAENYATKTELKKVESNSIPKGDVVAIMLVDELPDSPDEHTLYLIP